MSYQWTIEIRQLRYLVEVARTGTYAAASQRLHVSQPGLWKQVQLLERELGVVIFERTGRRVRLTVAGAALVERADRVLTGVEQLRALAGDLQTGRAGTLTLGCVPSHIVGFFAPVLGRFQREHPGTRVEVTEIELGTGLVAGAEPFADALLTGLVDVVSTPTADDRFDGFPIYDVDVVAALPDDHRWRGRRTLHIDRLRDEHLLVTPPGFLSRSLLDRSFAAVGTTAQVALECASPGALVALGREGLGVPVVASDAVASPDRPWPIVVDDTGPLRSTVWLQHRSPATSPLVDSFVSLARSFAR